MATVTVLASARTVYSQTYTGFSLSAYPGQYYLHAGVINPNGLGGPGAVSWIPSSRTGHNLAVFDPAPLGSAPVRWWETTRFSGPTSTDFLDQLYAELYVWDLQAIDAAYRPVDLTVPATVRITVLGGAATAGSVAPLRIVNPTGMVEPSFAPHVTVDDTTGFQYFTTGAAWADTVPGGVSAPPANTDALLTEVTDPAAYFGSSWSDLMNPGGPAGSSMLLPKMPFVPANWVTTDTWTDTGGGTWELDLSLGSLLASSRWFPLWLLTDPMYGDFSSGGDIFSSWTVGLTASLTVTLSAPEATAVPPLHQRQRAGGMDGHAALARGRSTRQSSILARGML